MRLATGQPSELGRTAPRHGQIARITRRDAFERLADLADFIPANLLLASSVNQSEPVKASHFDVYFIIEGAPTPLRLIATPRRSDNSNRPR